MKRGFNRLLAAILAILAISLATVIVQPAFARLAEPPPITAVTYNHAIAPAYISAQQSAGECEVYAVDLIGAWVDAGASAGSFTFTSLNDETCTAAFETDVLPLFTTENAWYEGSQACTECHFDNSGDSRHEMNLGSLEGILLGGDVLSDPPGVPVVVPGDWAASKLRARLRDNRMPPGWEFDIEETNRNGPLLELDSGSIYAVDLIGAWVNAGAAEGNFAWTDEAGAEHTGDFTADVLPLFTTEDAWYEGSQACTECHFDNSGDSRHEMNLGSLEGILLGGDVLSDPPGVPVVVPGDWEASKLRARLRDNRMPPGWEFDIEETNRDGPLVQAGVMGTTAVTESPTATAATAAMNVASAPPPSVPERTITETITRPTTQPFFLGMLGTLTAVFGFVMGVVLINRFRVKGRDPKLEVVATDVALLIFTLLAVGTGGLAVYAIASDAFTETHTIREEVPIVVDPVIPVVTEIRLEDWQAKIPATYASMTNPLIGDAAAVSAGEQLYQEHGCFACHGEKLDGQGPLSPGLTPKPVNLTDPALMHLPFMTDNYLFWRISAGGGQSPFFSSMPAWETMLNETERWQLVSYIRSQTGEAPFNAGEQAAIAIVEQMGCFACHRLERIGRGGKIGPVWDEIPAVAGSRVEGLTAEEYIHQSIVEPNAFVVPGFEDQAGTMPQDFGQRLTEDELEILINFLLQTPNE